jgi:lipopolysaccharide transport system permease protein
MVVTASSEAERSRAGPGAADGSGSRVGDGPTDHAHRVRIRPPHGWSFPQLREIWEYRDLLVLLTCRDVGVRYKQTVIGAAWAVLQPLLTMLIFTFVFSVLAKVPSDDKPYPLFAFAALLPWTYCSQAVTRIGMSLVNNANLISKVYFPRLIVPFSAALSPLVDFFIASGMLILLMVWYRTPPTWGVLMLPALLLLTVVTALAVGLWLAALNALYRDVSHLIPFLVQFWMYASPVGYPVSLVPERWRPLYSLNPMVGVIEGFRWALLGAGPPDLTAIAAGAIGVLVLLLGGLAFFQKTEQTLSDVI